LLKFLSDQNVQFIRTVGTTKAMMLPGMRNAINGNDNNELSHVRSIRLMIMARTKKGKSVMQNPTERVHRYEVLGYEKSKYSKFKTTTWCCKRVTMKITLISITARKLSEQV
jgi:hypothetical protein